MQVYFRVNVGRKFRESSFNMGSTYYKFHYIEYKLNIVKFKYQ